MTNKEVVEELRRRTKPFLHLKPQMPQSSYSLSLRNIDLGLSKPSTITKFFSRFGYEGTYDNWQMKAGYVIPGQKPAEV